MRYLSLSIFLLLVSGISLAQEIRFEPVDSTRASGLVVHEQSRMSVAYFFEVQGSSASDSQKLVLVLISPELHEIHRQSVMVESGATSLTVGFSGEFFLVQWKHLANRSRTYVSMDQQGVEVFRQSDENLSREQLSETMDPWVVSADPQQFLILQSKGAREGLQIQALNRTLETEWTKTIAPDRGGWDLIDHVHFQDRLYLLMGELDESQDLSGSMIVALSLHDGETLFRSRLEGGAETRPERIRAMEDGRLYCGGVLLDPESGEQNGLFTTFIEPDGKAFHVARYHWDAAISPDTVELLQGLQGGNLNLRVKEIIRDDIRDVHLIAETFTLSRHGGVKSKKGSEGSGERVIFGDLLVVNFGEDGLPKEVREIKRPSRSIVVEEVPGNIRPIELSNWLDEQGAFSIVAQAKQGMGNGFLGRKWEDGKEFLCYQSIQDTSDQSIECALATRDYLSERNSSQNRQHSLRYKEDKTVRTAPRWPRNRFYDIGHGMFLFYQSEGPFFEVWAQRFAIH